MLVSSGAGENHIAVFLMVSQQLIDHCLNETEEEPQSG